MPGVRQFPGGPVVRESRFSLPPPVTHKLRKARIRAPPTAFPDAKGESSWIPVTKKNPSAMWDSVPTSTLSPGEKYDPGLILAIPSGGRLHEVYFPPMSGIARAPSYSCGSGAPRDRHGPPTHLSATRLLKQFQIDTITCLAILPRRLRLTLVVALEIVPSISEVPYLHRVRYPE